MMIRIISFSLLLFYTLFLFRNTVEAKNYDGLKFLCADEIGPKLEFKIPNFGKEFLRENLFIKIYYGEHRNNFYDEEAKITKKSSPIDTSYFYYRSDNILYNQKTHQLVWSLKFVLGQLSVFLLDQEEFQEGQNNLEYQQIFDY